MFFNFFRFFFCNFWVATAEQASGVDFCSSFGTLVLIVYRFFLTRPTPCGRCAWWKLYLLKLKLKLKVTGFISATRWFLCFSKSRFFCSLQGVSENLDPCFLWAPSPSEVFRRLPKITLRLSKISKDIPKTSFPRLELRILVSYLGKLSVVFGYFRKLSDDLKITQLGG